MPIYIVRWPAFNVSLVRARDEGNLVDLLDEVADPGACRWAVYRGPLWIDLDLPADFKGPTAGRTARSQHDVQLTGVEETVAEGVPQYRASIGGEDTAWEMREAVTSWAFPHLRKALEEARAMDDEGQPAAVALAAALSDDLREMLQYQWRAAQRDRRDDPESALLKALGLTVAPPWLKRIFAHTDDT